MLCRVCVAQCNNPKTKEPKLTAAARIVPEWVDYDNEVKQLLKGVSRREDVSTSKGTPLQQNGGMQRIST